MFHETEIHVEDPSTSAVNQEENSIGLAKGTLILFAVAAMATLLWLFGAFQNDTYIKTTLNLQGSTDKGERLFRVNCVGCHGLSAQGLLGPDLHEVSHHLSERKIINQVIQGRTPPMPSFEMEPQQMADLMAYLKSLN